MTKHIYKDITGWFSFPKLYTEMVKRFPSGSRLVEIGTYHGCSFSYLVVEAMNSGKKFDIVGIDADIAQAICDKLGYELKIEDMEFDAILPAVQSGKADFGAAGMTVTEDRKSSVDFTDTYADASQVIIVKK